MNHEANIYLDLKGGAWSLTALDAEERHLVADLRQLAESHPNWNDFDN